MLEELHREAFADCVDQVFHVADPGSAGFDLRLIEVVEQIHTTSQEIFSLSFRGPADRFMPQGIHQLLHERMGELQIFLVPVGRDQDGYEYEAVFNRLVPSS